MQEYCPQGLGGVDFWDPRKVGIICTLEAALYKSPNPNASDTGCGPCLGSILKINAPGFCGTVNVQEMDRC